MMFGKAGGQGKHQVALEPFLHDRGRLHIVAKPIDDRVGDEFMEESHPSEMDVSSALNAYTR